MRRWLLALPLLVACSAPVETAATLGDPVVVDTSSAAARAQYQANLAFAEGYAPRCAPTSGRRRVLVTGFGRFESIAKNATGGIVSALSGFAYPDTSPPSDGGVDPPGPQLAGGVATVPLDHAGDVDVCALILPVYWDLAPILVAREIDAFDPELVVMNGVADDRQPLWIELGAVNEAMAAEDGSGTLTPVALRDGSRAPLVPNASLDEHARGNVLAWDAVRAAARDAIAARAGRTSGDGSRFGDLVQGALFAGFPRASNTYLCNDVAYTVGWLMDHSAGDHAALMQADGDARSGLDVGIARDVRGRPRVFVHWPSALDGDHLGTAAEVLRAMLDAQLGAMEKSEPGTNDRAELTDSSGATF